MTTVALDAFPQYSTNGGLPLAGGKIYSYQAGTSTPLATYTDRSGSVANANPVVLDSAGRADIWLSVNVAYKLVLEDSAGNVLDSIDDYYAGADPAQLVAAGIVPSTGGTYTGAVSFTGGATFDGTATQDLATMNSLGIAGAINSDLWTNPDFILWQRNTPSVADGNYGFDRTISLCDTGSVTLSQLSKPTDGIATAMRTTQPDAVAKRIGFLQVIESANCIAYRGSQLVFVPKIRVSATTTIRVALVAWTGAENSPTKDVVNSWSSTTYTAGNFFIADTLPIAVGAVSCPANTWTDVPVSSASPGGVVVPSTMTNIYMVVWTDTAVAQNVTLDAATIRCSRGTEVPLYTPPDFNTVFSQAYRYLKKGIQQGLDGYQLIGNGVGATMPLPGIAMRTTPTVLNIVLNSVINVTGGTITAVGVNSCRPAGTATATGSYQLIVTADFDAELGV